jgi:hypothetical protein
MDRQEAAFVVMRIEQKQLVVGIGVAAGNREDAAAQELFSPCRLRFLFMSIHHIR